MRELDGHIQQLGICPLAVLVQTSNEVDGIHGRELSSGNDVVFDQTLSPN